MNISFTSPIHYISNGSLYGFSPEQMIEEWCSIESKLEGADLDSLKAVKHKLLNYLTSGDKNELNLSSGSSSRLKLNTIPDIFNHSGFKDLKVLIIRKTSLTKLPESLGELKGLKSLNLKDNHLGLLPESFGQLKELTSLNLENNQLTALPGSFGQLKELTSLNLAHNRLTALPAVIGELQALISLDLGYNELTALPAVIGELQALTRLILWHNQLTALPAEIGELQALTHLDLRNNRLIVLPAEIFRLQALTILNLADNRLTALPAEIGELQALISLDLDKNRLTVLPAEIGKLQALTCLYLSGNRLRALPELFGRLQALTSLDLSGNRLRALPAEIGDLQALTILGLSDNNNLTSLPTEVLNLPSICQVNLQNCLSFSPQVLSNLRDAINVVGYQGPRIFYSINESPGDREEKSVEEMLRELYEVVGIPYEELKNVPNNSSLKAWLSRISYMSDFKASPEVKKWLVKNILSYIALAEKNKEFCDSFNVIIDGAAKTCGDRMALSIVHLGIASQLAKIDTKNMKDLANFLTKAVFAVSMLSDSAAKKVSELKFVDEIEVYLGFLVALKSELQLPIDIQDMLYFQSSSLTKDDLDRAALNVIEALDDENKVANFLINDKKWLEALKLNYPEDYASAQNPKMEIDDDNSEFWNLYPAKINEALIALTKKALLT